MNVTCPRHNKEFFSVSTSETLGPQVSPLLASARTLIPLWILYFVRNRYPMPSQAVIWRRLCEHFTAMSTARPLITTKGSGRRSPTILKQRNNTTNAPCLFLSRVYATPFHDVERRGCCWTHSFMTFHLLHRNEPYIQHTSTLPSPSEAEGFILVSNRTVITAIVTDMKAWN